MKKKEAKTSRRERSANDYRRQEVAKYVGGA